MSDGRVTGDDLDLTPDERSSLHVISLARNCSEAVTIRDAVAWWLHEPRVAAEANDLLHRSPAESDTTD